MRDSSPAVRGFSHHTPFAVMEGGVTSCGAGLACVGCPVISSVQPLHPEASLQNSAFRVMLEGGYLSAPETLAWHHELKLLTAVTVSYLCSSRLCDP